MARVMPKDMIHLMIPFVDCSDLLKDRGGLGRQHRMHVLASIAHISEQHIRKREIVSLGGWGCKRVSTCLRISGCGSGSKTSPRGMRSRASREGFSGFSSVPSAARHRGKRKKEKKKREGDEKKA